jgi:hypothetical protein
MTELLTVLIGLTWIVALVGVPVAILSIVVNGGSADVPVFTAVNHMGANRPSLALLPRRPDGAPVAGGGAEVNRQRLKDLPSITPDAAF